MIGASTDITAGQPLWSVRLSVAAGSIRVVSRHTTFQLAADPSPEQERALAWHEGAARFAFNQCLRLHLDARTHPHGERRDGGAGGDRVPWSGFDFINAFNAWKRSEQAGRRFVVDGAGDAELEVSGRVGRSGTPGSRRRPTTAPSACATRRPRAEPRSGWARGTRAA
jgi:hypothetical protein